MRFIASAALVAAIACGGFVPAQALEQYETLAKLCSPGTVTPGMRDEMNGLDGDRYVAFLKSCTQPLVGKGAPVKAPPAPVVRYVPPPPRQVDEKCYINVALYDESGAPASGRHPIEILNVEGNIDVKAYASGASTNIAVPCRIVESRLAKICLGGARPGNPAEFLRGNGWLARARQVLASGGRVLNPDKPIWFRQGPGTQGQNRRTYQSQGYTPAVMNGFARGVVAAIVTPRPTYYQPAYPPTYRPPAYNPYPNYNYNQGYGNQYGGPVAYVGQNSRAGYFGPYR